MEMPLPDNTAPMMTGQGPYGSVEMGGMFSVVKVRADQARGDYKNPGWFKQPSGTQAYEWKGPSPAALRSGAHGEGAMPLAQAMPTDVELHVRKPTRHLK